MARVIFSAIAEQSASQTATLRAAAAADGYANQWQPLTRWPKSLVSRGTIAAQRSLPAMRLVR